MARPLWSDAGTDPHAIAAHLQDLADTADTLRFEPRALPDGLDAGLLHQAAMLRAKAQLTTAHGEKDRILAQEVRAIDDLVRSANLLMERLREWYALHAPEAVRASEGKDLASLVADNARAEVLQALDLAQASLGTDLDDADQTVLQGFAGALRGVHDSWHAIERRVQDLMQEVAPNLASVVGPILGARLIAQAGSLQRLAGFPAGTVQTLGAETALFRHLKEGTDPPKHGFLFQHPKVHQAAPWHRGGVAKALALQAALAAKADAFTQRDIRDHLAQRLESDLANVAKRPKPKRPAGRGPPRQARTGGKPGGPRGQSLHKGGKPGGRSGATGGRSGGKPFQKSGKPGSKPGGKPGGGPKKRKGPGAFRGDGGPARPPGGR